MNEATREEMIKEAQERLKILHLHRNVISELANGVVNVSHQHGTPLDGALYWADDEQQEIINRIEKANGGLVYHAVFSANCEDPMLSLLYITKYKEEWEYDRDALKDGLVFAWVENLVVPWCSEFGTIQVESRIGGLIRTD